VNVVVLVTVFTELVVIETIRVPAADKSVPYLRSYVTLGVVVPAITEYTFVSVIEDEV
jgi:hypothetical protein